MSFPAWLQASLSENLNISNGEVHVWMVWLDDWEWSFPSSSDILDDEELRHATSYRFEKDQRRFISRRMLLKKLLSLYLGIAPQMICFRYNPHGKPHLATCPESDSIQFNISHSQGLAVYVFGRNCRLGVDLESLQLLPEVDALISRWFPAQQARFLQKLSSQEKHLAFYRLWTLKEAYLKALGKGLGGPDDFVDSLPDNLKTSWHHTSMEFYRMDSWSFLVLKPAPNFFATIAVDKDNYRLRCFELEAGADFRVQPMIRELPAV
jgi:4'-phosphopantetheinyl transferase